MNLIFFRLIEVSTKKERKTASIRVAFFLSFNFHFISAEKSVILTLINEGLFQTFDVVEIHMTSQ